METKTKVMIAVAIAVVLIIILVALFASGVFSGGANAPMNAPVVQKVGDYFWSQSPGSGYVNGLTYPEAQAYCANSGGKLAQREDLIRAGQERGYQMCAAGWLTTQWGGADAGYYMQQASSGCGKAGFNGWTASNSDTRKLGVYCVGTADPGIQQGRAVVNLGSAERFGNARQTARKIYGV